MGKRTRENMGFNAKEEKQTIKKVFEMRTEP